MPTIGHCRICGAFGPLSFEHVPPKAAFNNRGVLLSTLDDYFENGTDRDPAKVRKRKSPKGMGHETLCAKCNNDTGAWYGNAYVDWAYQGMHIRHAAPVAGSSLALPFHVFPGRVAKQILCMFASVLGPEVFKNNPDLIRYVLNRDARGIPSKYRLYCYVVSRDSMASRFSGFTAAMQGGLGSGGTVIVSSEISFAPFGYVLTADSPPPDHGLADITFFTQSGFQDYRDVHLRLPTRPVNAYFPSDFRSRDEWEQTLRNTASKVEAA
jgi:hypothetical protein